MIPYDYESELYPIGVEHDFDWYKAMILSLPSEELKKVYEEQKEYLDTLRANEPAKKRGKKDTYRFWIKRTHDKRDLLNDIAKEINTRALSYYNTETNE